jgi:LysM repeat protein
MLPLSAPLPLLALALALATPAGSAQAKGRASERVVTHVVKAGDSLGGIANRYNVEVGTIREANHLRGDLIRVGAALTIPGGRRPRGDASRTTAQLVNHLVMPGETLGSIAKRYGTTVAAVRKTNRLRKGQIIRIGKTLKVRSSVPARARRQLIYTIAPGDTLSAIGQQFGMSANDLQLLNPRKDPRRLRIGDRIKVYVDGPESRSAAVGGTSHGRLVNAERLPPGPGYHRRNPARSWGTNETITELLRVVAQVKLKHPDAHDLVIEDLSAKQGGPIAPHKSHQSGRDVDTGVYHQGYGKEGPKRFLDATRVPLDYDKTWTLLHALVGDSEESSRTAYIFWDYGAQKLVHDWALKRGKPKALLRRMFQYPRGRRSMQGVIRHVSGHKNHLHIRFKCPAGDRDCT